MKINNIKIKVLFTFLFISLFSIRGTSQCCDSPTKMSRKEIDTVCVEIFDCFIKSEQFLWINSLYNIDTSYFRPVFTSNVGLEYFLNNKIVFISDTCNSKDYYWMIEIAFKCDDYEHCTDAILYTSFKAKETYLIIGVTVKKSKNKWNLVGFNIYHIIDNNEKEHD